MAARTAMTRASGGAAAATWLAVAPLLGVPPNGNCSLKTKGCDDTLISLTLLIADKRHHKSAKGCC